MERLKNLIYDFNQVGYSSRRRILQKDYICALGLIISNVVLVFVPIYVFDGLLHDYKPFKMDVPLRGISWSLAACSLVAILHSYLVRKLHRLSVPDVQNVTRAPHLIIGALMFYLYFIRAALLTDLIAVVNGCFVDKNPNLCDRIFARGGNAELGIFGALIGDTLYAAYVLHITSLILSFGQLIYFSQEAHEIMMFQVKAAAELPRREAVDLTVIRSSRIKS